MKNILIAALVLLLISGFNRPYLEATFVQRITQTSGTVSYAQSTADIWLVIDNAATIAALTIPFPLNPRDAQTFGFSSRGAITSITMTASTGTIVSGITTLAIATGRAAWIYSSEANRWFRIG